MLVQPKTQTLRALLDAQAWRLHLSLCIDGMLLQPVQHLLGRARRLGTAITQQQFARQRGLPHQAAIAQAHGDAGIAKSVQRIAGLTFFTRALQVHCHAGQHLFGPDGLGHIVHTTGLQRGHQVLGLGQPGHENDRDMGGARGRLEPSRHLKSVDAGHHGVQQHNVGQHLLRAL